MSRCVAEYQADLVGVSVFSRVLASLITMPGIHAVQVLSGLIALVVIYGLAGAAVSRMAAIGALRGRLSTGPSWTWPRCLSIPP